MTTELNRFNLAAWRHQLANSFLPLDVEPLGHRTDFDARILGSAHGTLRATMVEVFASPHVVRRSALASSNGTGSLLVSVQLGGSCLVRQDGREAVLGPADVAIYDSSRPYELHFLSGEHRQAVLQVPSDYLVPSCIRGRTAIRIAGDEGLGRVVSPMLAAIPGAFPEVLAAEGKDLFRSAFDLLDQCLRRFPTASHRESLLESANDLLRLHADNSRLGPEEIAAQLYISVSHLHRVFQGSGTSVRRSLIEFRLKRAAEDLWDMDRRDRTIRDIAYSRGFKDAAHFTRAFTKRYGVPPSIWRKHSTLPSSAHAPGNVDLHS